MQLPQLAQFGHICLKFCPGILMRIGSTKKGTASFSKFKLFYFLQLLRTILTFTTFSWKFLCKPLIEQDPVKLSLGMGPSNHASQAKIFVKYCNIVKGKSIAARQHLGRINAYVGFGNLSPGLYQYLASLWSAYRYMYMQQMSDCSKRPCRWGWVGSQCHLSDFKNVKNCVDVLSRLHITVTN